MAKTLAMVREFRARDARTPIVLMGYYNPIYRYGDARFAADAAEAGVDGLIIVDLPPEEEGELRPHADAAGLSLIRLVSPNTPDARIATLMEGTSGFVYYVSITGITGTRSAEAGSVARAVARIRKRDRAARRGRVRHQDARPGRRDRRASPTPRWSARRSWRRSPNGWTRTAGPRPAPPRPCSTTWRRWRADVRGARQAADAR